MSSWTHIVASIDVDTYIEDHDIQSVVEGMLEGAPRITGSEGDANIFVNVLPGHNSWTSKDCNHCKYGTAGGLGLDCDAEDDYVCQSGEYQTRVVITVVGDLRDRIKAATHKEWKAFQKYVARKNGCDFMIRNCACRIQGY